MFHFQYNGTVTTYAQEVKCMLFTDNNNAL